MAIEQNNKLDKPITTECNVPLSGPINLKGRVAIITRAKDGLGQASGYTLARAEKILLFQTLPLVMKQ